jgi:hypothetical protein
VYGYVPLGLLFILYALRERAIERMGSFYLLYQAMMALLVGVGLWWSLRPPGFVRPDWVRWVEAYPQKLQQAMEQAVAAGEDWKAHVTSPEKLEAWVKTLRRKGPRSR